MINKTYLFKEREKLGKKTLCLVIFSCFISIMLLCYVEVIGVQ